MIVCMPDRRSINIILLEAIKKYKKFIEENIEFALAQISNLYVFSCFFMIFLRYLQLYVPASPSSTPNRDRKAAR
jgi:hypothetical protein